MSSVLRNMTEKYDCEGLWWDPKRIELKIGGVLRVAPDGMSLVIYGDNNHFGETLDAIRGSILGATVTLFDATIEGEITTGEGFKKTSYNIRYALAGQDSEEDDKYREVSVFFSDMEASGCLGLVDHRFDGDAELLEGSKPVLKTIQLDDCIFEIENRVSSSFSRYEGSCKEKVCFTFRSEKEVNFDWCIGKLFDLRNLLTVLHGRECIFQSIFLELSRHRLINLYFDQPHLESQQQEVSRRIFIPLKSLDDNAMKTVISLWFGEYRDKMLSVHLFCRTFYYPGKHQKTDLVLFCQMLEAFHRAFFGGQYLTEAEYEPHLKTMIASIPPALEAPLKDRLRSVLKFGYQYSQRKRFTELLAATPNEVKVKIANNCGDFVGRVIDTRNFYTHSDEFSKTNVLEDEDVTIVNFALGGWFNFLLLQQLGVSKDLLVERLNYSHFFWMYGGFKGHLNFV